MENISRTRLLLCTLLGIAIVAAIAFLQPSGNETAAPTPPTKSLLAEALSQVPENIPSRHFNLQHWQSSLDVPVYFIHTPELDMLDIVLNLNAGSSRDGQHQGLATLTASLLDNGSMHKTADEIARHLEQLGSEYFSFSDRDRTMLNLRTLSDKEHLPPSINLFTEILSQPAFRKDDFDRLKNQQLQTITSPCQRPGVSKLAVYGKISLPEPSLRFPRPRHRAIRESHFSNGCTGVSPKLLCYPQPFDCYGWQYYPGTGRTNL